MPLLVKKKKKKNYNSFILTVTLKYIKKFIMINKVLVNKIAAI